MQEIVEREYKNFRSIVQMAVFFLGPLFGLLTSAPLFISEYPRFALNFFWLYLAVYSIELFTVRFLFRDAWSSWFAVYLCSAIGGMGIFGASLFFTLLSIKSPSANFFVILSWFLLFPLMWWWGSRVYLSRGEIKESVLRSKRIDLDKAMYSPYVIPSDLYESKWARRWLAIDAAFGGLALGVAVYVSYFVSSRYPDSGNPYSAFWGYLLVLISMWAISVGYHEAKWMRRWEKKTGRKIYVKEIIQWKQLQAKKLAEQN